MSWFDLDHYEIREQEERPCVKDCSFCGTPGLEWAETADGWRLLDEDGEQHKCPRIADASEFKALT